MQIILCWRSVSGLSLSVILCYISDLQDEVGNDTGEHSAEEVGLSIK
jgi:hypothetical protein